MLMLDFRDIYLESSLSVRYTPAEVALFNRKGAPLSSFSQHIGVLSAWTSERMIGHLHVQSHTPWMSGVQFIGYRDDLPDKPKQTWRLQGEPFAKLSGIHSRNASLRPR